MEFLSTRLNYKAIRAALGISYKQISSIVAGLASAGIIDYKIVEDDGYHVEIVIKDAVKLNSFLFKKYTKGFSTLDLKGLLVEQSTDTLSTLESEYFTCVKNLKLKYPASPSNRYFKHFNAGNKRQFFATFAARLEKNKINLLDLEAAFKSFCTQEHWSLADIFNMLSYSTHEKLLDFLWIQTEGKVANISMEAKAAKELAKWMANEATTFEEIEDCWISVIVPSQYNPSLVSLKKALQLFSKIKVERFDGRFTAGTSLWVEKSQNSLYNALKSSVDNVEL
jgi:hypothetical protein